MFVSRATAMPRRRALTLNGRSVTDRLVDLLVAQLKSAIQRLLDAKGVRARVLDKVNRYGEIVIGVILEKPGKAPDGDAEREVGRKGEPPPRP
jgi:hypothetical protein